MKRIITALTLTVCLFALTAPVCAEGGINAAEELSDVIKADELWSSLPKETRDQLSEMGISSIESIDYKNTDLFTLLKAVSPSVERNIAFPLKCGAKILLMLMLCLIASMLTGGSESLGRITTALCGLIFLSGASDLAARVVAVETSSCTFMQAYVPVFASLTAAGGGTQAASGYSVFLIGVCAAVKTACDSVIIPVTGMLLALCAVVSITQTASLAAADFILKTVKWSLGIICAVAGAMFSLQTGIAAAADSASLRTAKFAVSGFVPIVGNTLSEALGTVVSAAGIMRGSVGVTGIAALLIMLLPTAIELAVWSVICRLTSFFCISTGMNAPAGLFTRLTGVTDVLIAVVALTGALFIFATAILVGR